MLMRRIRAPEGSCRAQTELLRNEIMEIESGGAI